MASRATVPNSPRLTQRFPGEFGLGGLALTGLTFAIFGAPAALPVAACAGLAQLIWLRNGQRDAVGQAARGGRGRWSRARPSELAHERAALPPAESFQDPETGLCNLRQFAADFADLVAANQSFSVVLLQARDAEYPEAQFDADTSVVAADQLAATACAEHIFARVANRSFAILLAGTGKSAASAYMERCRRRFDEVPVEVEGQEFLLTLAGGVAQYDSTMRDFSSLLRAAAQDLAVRDGRWPSARAA